MGRASSLEIATRLMNVINTYLQEESKGSVDAREISLSVYEGIATALVATIGITVRPENVPMAALLIMKGINATVAVGLDEAIKLSRDLRAGPSARATSPDNLEELFNRPEKRDKHID